MNQNFGPGSIAFEISTVQFQVYILSTHASTRFKAGCREAVLAPWVALPIPLLLPLLSKIYFNLEMSCIVKQYVYCVVCSVLRCS